MIGTIVAPIGLVKEPREGGDSIVMVIRLEEDQDAVFIHFLWSNVQWFVDLVAKDLQLERRVQGGEIGLEPFQFVLPARVFGYTGCLVECKVIVGFCSSPQRYT